MIEIMETIGIMVTVFGYSILCFYWGYRFRQQEEDMGDDFVTDTTTYGYSEGKWIRGKYTDDDLRYNDYSCRCDRCGKIVDFEENYCPKCGARMYKE